MGDMMIVNSRNILSNAKKNKIAIPHFNINNLEWTKYILEECNNNNCPVILGVSEGAIKYMGGTKTVVNLVKSLDEELNIKVPVVIHLDHGSNVEICKKAIEDGFTSVMIDASNYPFEKNIEITKEVVKYAKEKNVSVEAELGHIGNDNNYYTNIEEAKIFVEKTGIDSLAPAIGTVHGIYKDKPNLDIDLCNNISKVIDIPLVLHGGSGLDDEILKQVIKAGINKININTELQIVWSNEVKKYIKENDVYDPRKIISSGEEMMKKVIKHKINVLSSN